jgi:hypothetical protein
LEETIIYFIKGKTMEENLNELIKTNNTAILIFGGVKQPKSVSPKIIKPKPVFGTKEWANRNENCLDGCGPIPSLTQIPKGTNIHSKIAVIK